MTCRKFRLKTCISTGYINKSEKVKILGNGELKTKLVFKVDAVSEKAKTAIEAVGGTVEILK